MKTLYDADADTLYITFVEAEIADSKEIAVGVILNRDPDGRIVAIEFRDASAHLAPAIDLNALR